MKKFLLLFLTASTACFAQDHYIGANTSGRTGIVNGALNPAELANLSKKFEVNITGLSFNVSNNIVSMNDLTSDNDLEDLIFDSSKAVSANFDGEFMLPGVAMRWQKWGFAITSKANVKFDLVDVDPSIGQSIINTVDITSSGTTTIGNDYNQRLNGTTWGEIGFSAARNVYEDDQHLFNAGITLKLLFPGAYTNFGVDKFHGEITTIYNAASPENTLAYLNNTTATLNFAYSGNLANSFVDASDYSSSLFGGLHGFATDLGVNYRWKDTEDKKYKINAGVAFRNIGSMTFSDNNNSSNSYRLDIHEAGPGLDLTVFSGAESIKDVEKILLDSGYMTKTKSNKDFKVKLPTTFSVYADFKLYTKFFITGQLQQKLHNNNDNDQITSQNSFSIIPRVNLGFFEAYIPFTHNEISGGNTGLGFRLGGFYMGSGSIISALLTNSKQVDMNMGFRWAFL